MRDTKGRFIRGHDLINPKDKTTGRFLEAEPRKKILNEKDEVFNHSLEEKLKGEVDRVKEIYEKKLRNENTKGFFIVQTHGIWYLYYNKNICRSLGRISEAEAQKFLAIWQKKYGMES